MGRRGTSLPVNSILLSSENKKDRINEAFAVDKRTIGYKRRMLSMEKGTHAMLELLKAAKNAAIPAGYVLFDSRFSSPSTIHSVKETTGINVRNLSVLSPQIYDAVSGEP